jgi:hypothetical protein
MRKKNYDVAMSKRKRYEELKEEMRQAKEAAKEQST